MTPAQFRSMVGQAQQKQRRAIQQVNQAINKHNREIRAHNARVRTHNARVRANRQRLRRELARMQNHPVRIARHVTYRASVQSLQTSYVRLESSPARSAWGSGDELLDLAAGETANSVRSLNLLESGERNGQDDDLNSTSLERELHEISPDLDQRWRGALYALSPANPDAARHFCASSREILVSILDSEAPDQVVLDEMPNCPTTDTGRPTRRAKIEFCLEQKELAASELIDFVDEDLTNVASLFGVFNDGTHGSAGRFDIDELSALKLRVEDAVRFLHRLVR